MFGRRYELFRLFGFPVRLDLGWFVIALLVTWSLAAGVFPALVPGLAAWVRWTMGAAGAIGLFASILLHECAHAVVARSYGIPTRAITLWIFGGVAETTSEPPTASIELRVALAGPACSAAIAAVLLLSATGLDRVGAPVAVTVILGWTGWMNLLLAVFNLLPGLPLDGGRVLRALLWRHHGDLHRATRSASRAGQGLGLVLMGAGVVFAFAGNLLGGLWWVLIGSFLRRAAEGGLRQAEARRVLEGIAVHRVMDSHPAVVLPGTTLERFVQDFAYAKGRMRFPVAMPGQLLGVLDAADVRAVPRERWAGLAVDALVKPISADELVHPDATAAEALRRMEAAGVDTLLVAADGRLEGVVSVEDLVRSIGVRTALEGERGLGFPRPTQTVP